MYRHFGNKLQLLCLAILIVLCSLEYSAAAEQQAGQAQTQPAEQEIKPKSPPPAGTPTQVINIGVTQQADAELFCVDFNKPKIPDINTVDNGSPRIFFDVHDVHEWQGKKRYDVNANYIKAVRTHHNAAAKSLRIVLDLSDQYNYRVDPSWVEAYYLFCIAVSKR
ncbi:hypothetical protein [Oleidesulfovibrio sp.]|uniref:hypothetical protein n=1 Tax=Oleidesulfovibrio sp. TaxID=2909707 RepID=UPI003A839474